MAKVYQLKQELLTIKKGSLSISEYFLKIKIFRNNLRTVGQIATEFAMVLSVLNGLGHDYDPIISVITSLHNKVSMQEAQYMLMVHEQQGGQNSNGVRNGNGNGRGRGRGDRGKWNNGNKLFCQLCSKQGHSALQCYKRFDHNWQGNNKGN
ncbi:hypothetical protein Ddye_012829 [Dipteronia dyeriana]|uniref:Retrotransposon gag domain-containing protein n=1 Tax=Dipteronia dyeriana TaxID=168575 RepID=A0AAD9X5G9_9ROSI|nr:hypothetical protein Ddye_012829 [Dipteronia dyeriana]